MKKMLNILSIIFLLIFFGAKEANAQTLSFEPTQKGVNSGVSFNVKININTASQQTMGADALIVYDPNILTIQSVENGGFYSNFSSNPLSSANNKYLISGFETDATSYKAGSGVLASITFSGKSNGTSSVSFDCVANSKAESNIIQSSTSNDIINCSSLVSASYTVGGSSDSGGSSSSNPSPTALPATGSTEVTMIAVGVGVILTILGLVFKL